MVVTRYTRNPNGLPTLAAGLTVSFMGVKLEKTHCSNHPNRQTGSTPARQQGPIHRFVHPHPRLHVALADLEYQLVHSIRRSNRNLRRSPFAVAAISTTLATQHDITYLSVALLLSTGSGRASLLVLAPRTLDRSAVHQSIL
jgi:hypothetical protein